MESRSRESFLTIEFLTVTVNTSHYVISGFKEMQTTSLVTVNEGIINIIKMILQDSVGNK